jgi:hypothetical protein
MTPQERAVIAAARVYARNFWPCPSRREEFRDGLIDAVKALDEAEAKGERT